MGEGWGWPASGWGQGRIGQGRVETKGSTLLALNSYEKNAIHTHNACIMYQNLHTKSAHTTSYALGQLHHVLSCKMHPECA